MDINFTFTGFPKIARLSREVIVTEKIDGTNAQIYITEDGELFAGSRTRWITPEDDNAGFARWAQGNKSELLELGPGRHFGEWWGSGIMRGYGLVKGEKRFTLFNVARWGESRPAVCGVVPVLWQGMFEQLDISAIMGELKNHGSHVAPGFMRPEGVVIFHTGGNFSFKKTFEKDEVGKEQSK